MDNTKPYTKAPKPEIGRGCTFYYAPEGVAAKPCEGCYKLHETAWLEQYPQHTPTDIFEVRFKNTRRSYYQNVNNLPLERLETVMTEAGELEKDQWVDFDKLVDNSFAQKAMEAQ